MIWFKVIPLPEISSRFLARLLAVGLLLLGLVSASHADLTTGLVAYYPFDGNASDMSGNGRHGTLDGSVPATDRLGSPNGALAFDGNNDSVSLGNSINVDFSALTISAWVNGTGGPIFTRGVHSQNHVGHIELDFNGWFQCIGTGTNFDFTYDQLPTSQWAQVTAVWDGTTAKVYTNGSDTGLSEQSSGQIPFNNLSARIGLRPKPGQHVYFNGSIDELRIYDRALSATEVAELYAMESALPAGSVTLGKLAPELSDLLDGNATIEQALPAGSVIAVKPGDPAPAGYTLFQRNEYNATLTWEEKAPVSVGRYAYDGVEVVDGKIYFVGGNNGTDSSVAERYDPTSNQWETLNPLSAAKHGVASTSLNGKLYVLGGFNYTSGVNFSEVEVFDPSNSQWTGGTSLPIAPRLATAITHKGKIYLIGGRDDSNQLMNQVLEFSDETSTWITKTNMPTARNSLKLVSFKNKIWAIGGFDGSPSNKVESYDPISNSWLTEASLTTPRISCSAWISNGYIVVGGGSSDGSNRLDSLEYYDPFLNEWKSFGTLPENKTNSDAVILNGKVYLVSGSTANNVYSNKVYSADLPPPAMNLYFRNGNATAEAATEPALDGNLSITLNMLAPDALAKLDVNQTHAQSAGSVLAVPKDSAPPAGYSLYKRSDRNSSLVWEEKASVSVARDANDGVIAYEGKMYFIGGYNGSGTNVTERYDPLTNQWQTLSPLTTARFAHSCTVLNDKIYAIGGNGLSSVEIYDPALDQWTAGTGLPGEVRYAEAITVGGKILLIGGRNSSSQNLSQVLEFDPSNNQWSQKTPMNTTRLGPALTYLDGKVWVLGGLGGAQGTNLNTVEIYDATADSWTTGPSFSVSRVHLTSWTANGRIYVAGGYNPWVDSIEVWEPSTNQWSDVGSLPESKSNLDSVVLHGKVYVVAGSRSSTDYSNTVFAANITPPMDMYFRDANASGGVTLDKFAGEVVSKLDGTASALPPIGAVSAIDHNGQTPADHAVLDRTDHNATHVWQEMAPVSVARHVHDGVEVLDGKIYCIGGRNSSTNTTYDLAERYDPETNQWETLQPLSNPRAQVATAVLAGKLYAIGGSGLASVEIFDPQTGQWSAGPALPGIVSSASAITAGGKIFLVGGLDPTGQNLNQVLELDPSTNQWSQKTPMPMPRHGLKLVVLDNKVWAIGGYDGSSWLNNVGIYDYLADTWATGPALNTPRLFHSAWESHGEIYVAGGENISNGNYLNSIEVFDPNANQWAAAGNLPENNYVGDSVVLAGKVYIVAGSSASGVFSNKVFAADLPPPARDLYFRDGKATAPAQPTTNQAPVFSGGTTTFTTAENNVSASFVVSASDPDANTTLVYAKSGPDSGKFDLNASTGTLTFINTPDFEANASAAGNNAYSLTITATDGEGNATQSVTVNVTNMVEDFDGDGIEDHFDPDDDNDGFSDTAEIAYGSDPRNPASVANQAPAAIDLNGTTVAENQPAGTIVGDFNATDSDTNATHVFAFAEGNGSAHNHLFTIDANGTLRTLVTFDHEANATRSIRVRADDEYNASIEQTFVITVLDDSADNNTSVVDDNGTFVDTNATFPDNNATVPDSNGTYVDTNATVADGNGTFVDTNATSPDNNGTLPDSNTTVPNPNATLPDDNETIPDQNGTVAEPNEPHPDQNGTFVDTNATLPDDNATVTDSNATVPDPNTTPPDQNETIVEPHEPHTDGNGTVPDQNDTFVDHNQTHVDTNATSPDNNATLTDSNATVPDPNSTVPDPNTTPPDQNETIVEPHEPHLDGNGTVPDQNGTFVDHNQTHVDTNGTPQDANTTVPDSNATIPDANEPVVDTNETIVPPPPPTYRPIARTLPAETDAEGRLTLNGVVLTDGGETVSEVGFILSNSLFGELHSPGAIIVGGTLSGDAFTASAAMPDFGKRFYYRAYATNAKGTNFGSPKRFVLPEPAVPAAWWASAEEATAGWRISSWFGAFRPYENGWMYHASLSPTNGHSDGPQRPGLGWAYAVSDGADGLWLWLEDYGWLWTKDGLWPYLHSHDKSGWLYLLGNRKGKPVFYDYSNSQVIHLPEY